MHYKRRYIQFNNFVFDEYDMIAEDDSSASFKQSRSSYAFGNGSYVPFKKKGVVVNEGSVSMTLTLRMKKVPCEYRKFYPLFAKSELLKPGKLWAIQNGTVIWAYAYPRNFSEGSESYGELEVDISFGLPEGVWHKADKLRTFMYPHDVCDFMECVDFHDIDPCLQEEGDCCHCQTLEYNNTEETCECCECVTKDMALCYHKDELEQAYGCDYFPYRMVYNCAKAEEFFGDPMGSEHLGQKFCSTCGKLIAGILYSDTDISTENVRITLHGTLHNPYVEINGNGNYIEGDYDGYLVINSDGSVYSYAEGCKCDTPLPVENWKIPVGMDYGWTVYTGKNRLIIDPGACCGTTCAYIEVDSLTI